jgi:hypothetical protein
MQTTPFFTGFPGVPTSGAPASGAINAVVIAAESGKEIIVVGIAGSFLGKFHGCDLVNDMSAHLLSFGWLVVGGFILR